MAYKIVGEGGGSGGNGADKEREELQELARAIVDAAKQGAWTATQAVEQPRQENAPPRLPWPVFRSLKQDSFTRGGGPRGGGASRGNGSWSLPDSSEERSNREIQREMEDKARKRHEYERRWAEEERRRRAAGPEPAFQGFTHGGGSRGGGASRGNDPWGQAEQSPFIRGGISGGGGARRGGSPWEQVAYPPDGAGSGGPEQELTEEASPEREEEAEQEEKSVSLPPVRQLLAKIAGAAGAGIAGAAGAGNFPAPQGRQRLGLELERKRSPRRQKRPGKERGAVQCGSGQTGRGAKNFGRAEQKGGLRWDAAGG